MKLKVDLGQAVLALTDALDLVGVDSFQHGKRVGFMVHQGANLRPWDLGAEQLFNLGMLHDLGVSSTLTHHYLVQQLAWEGAEEHARVGFDRLRRFAPLAELAPYVLYHHTPWERFKDLEVAPEVAILANWVFLCDRADVMAAGFYQKNVLEQKPNILERIKTLSGSYFAPELVAMFCGLAEHDAFWLAQEPRHLNRFLEAQSKLREPLGLGFAQVLQLARIFAEIVDTKSRFTHEHSVGVAQLSRYLGQNFGLDEETCDKLEIAGLLHDLGKLQVPDEILDKPGPLDEIERARINHHSFETFQILSAITGLEDIARWASLHHESPDGTGYPFGEQGTQLPLEARIIAVADVFQALAQNRPYRKPLAPMAIAGILADFARAQKLDPELALWCADHAEDCQQVALWKGPSDLAAETAARL